MLTLGDGVHAHREVLAVVETSLATGLRVQLASLAMENGGIPNAGSGIAILAFSRKGFRDMVDCMRRQSGGDRGEASTGERSGPSASSVAKPRGCGAVGRRPPTLKPSPHVETACLVPRTPSLT